MKKRRHTFWRTLLALLLGAGTWWGVEWWQVIRPVLELCYERDQQTMENNEKQRNRVSCLAILADPLIHCHAVDRDGRWLVLEYIHQQSQRRWFEMVDMTTRKIVANHANLYAPVDLVFFQRNGQFCSSNTDVFMIGRNDKRPSNELWKWNLLTNQVQLVQEYSPSSRCSLYQTGNALLVMERRDIVLPSLLAPTSLAKLVSLSIEQFFAAHEVLLMHVYDLPDMKKRITLAFPGTPGHINARLTPSGNHLIIPDVEPPQYGLSLTESDTDDLYSKWYPYAAHRLRDYNTRTGELWWEQQGLSQTFTSCLASNDKMIAFSTSTPVDQASPFLMLHLPSRKASNSHLFRNESLVPLNNTTVQWLRYDTATRTASHVQTIENGEDIVAARLTTEGRLVSGATQDVIQTYRYSFDWLPHRFREWLSSYQFFSDRWGEPQRQLQVVDYQHQRRVWTRPLHAGAEVRISEHWLMIQEDHHRVVTVQVFALPFPSWSPWWAITAGLVVFLLSLLYLRPRRPASWANG